MNILVIANCHLQPICEGLKSHPQVNNVLYIPIHLRNTSHFIQAIENINNSNLDGFTILQFEGMLEQIEFGDIIRKRANKIYSFTNIYFSGLHPDLTYIGGRGKRILSPLGDYHSKLCFISYLKGLTVSECAALFGETTYEKLDYFNEWKVSSDELLSRDSSLDVKFADEFLNLVKLEPSLYTVNHPMGSVFSRLLNLIFLKLDIEAIEFPPQYYPNFLATNAWWPVYPEIASYHRISYSTPLLFRAADGMGSKLYGLNEFIALSYKSYFDQQIKYIDLPENFKKWIDVI